MLLTGLKFGPGFASEMRFKCIVLSQRWANTILSLIYNLRIGHFENVLTSAYTNIRTLFNKISTQVFQNWILKAAVIWSDSRRKSGKEVNYLQDIPEDILRRGWLKNFIFRTHLML